MDIVLVLDMSSSMRRPTRTGRPKYEAAIEAATELLDLVALEPDREGRSDRLAVVAFNNDAWIEQAATSDREALRAGLSRLGGKVAEGTRLDLALLRAAESVYDLLPQSESQPVVIMMTDGLPNRVPPADDGRVETTILAAAAAAKELGARVYTIGVGQPDDIDPVLLRAVASDASMYRHGSDAEELARIYRELAYSLGCPPR